MTGATGRENGGPISLGFIIVYLVSLAAALTRVRGFGACWVGEEVVIW